VSDVARTSEPHDRLTRLCAVMTDALRADPECGDDVRCVIMLNDDERGGIVIDGYEGMSDNEAIIDLFLHLKSIFEANGKQLLLAPLGKG
jgi:hypothetical protein